MRRQVCRECYDSKPERSLRSTVVLHREYEPIEHYRVGTNRVKLDELLDAKVVRRRLVLVTSEGRYVIRDWIRRWDPVSIFFKNHYTGIIQPIRSTYQGKAYGSNAKYIVLLKLLDGKEEVIPIYANDYRFRRFRKFEMPFDALKSAHALEEFLFERAIAGDLSCADLSVFDMEAWRKEAYRGKDETFQAPPVSWFKYYIVGRIHSWWDNFQMNRQNRALQRKRVAEAKKATATEERSARASRTR